MDWTASSVRRVENLFRRYLTSFEPTCTFPWAGKIGVRSNPVEAYLGGIRGPRYGQKLLMKRGRLFAPRACYGDITRNAEIGRKGDDCRVQLGTRRASSRLWRAHRLRSGPRPWFSYDGVDFGLPLDCTAIEGADMPVRRLPEALRGKRRHDGRLNGLLRLRHQVPYD